MSLLLFVAFAAVQTPPETAQETPSEGADVTVIAQRFRDINVDLRIDRHTRRARCQVRRSSGDRLFDKLFCNAVVECNGFSGQKTEFTVCVDHAFAAIPGLIRQQRARR